MKKKQKENWERRQKGKNNEQNRKNLSQISEQGLFTLALLGLVYMGKSGQRKWQCEFSAHFLSAD